MTAPDLFIFGAQKAATSWLFNLLSTHEDVCGNFGNEYTYFSDPHEYDRGEAWADKRYFPQCGPHRCRRTHLAKGVDMLPDPHAHRRAAAANPRMRVVCVLRDPVERAYSAYHWTKAHGIERSPTFRVALDRQGEESIDGRPTHGAYLANGRYAELLRGLANTFPSSQVHTILYDDIVGGGRWLDDLLDWAGLSAGGLGSSPATNSAHSARSPMVARLLAHHSRLRSAIGEVLPLKVRFAIVNGLWRLNSRTARQRPMEPEDREWLEAYFAPHNAELAVVLDRSIPWPGGNGTYAGAGLARRPSYPESGGRSRD